MKQARALKQKLAEAASCAAAAAEEHLQVKQQSVSAAKAAAAAATGLVPVVAVAQQQVMMSGPTGQQTAGSCPAAADNEATADATDGADSAHPESQTGAPAAAAAACQVVLVAAPNSSLNTSNVVSSLAWPLSTATAAAQARMVRQQEQATAQEVAGQVREQVRPVLLCACHMG
jgi:hypothetical protein